MPTLDEWEGALVTPRRVYVESSPELLHELQQRNAKKDYERQQRGQTILPRKDNLSQVAAFAPNRDLQIVPAYLLHRLGVVTTPAIENLADICSTWAYLRYLWAFEIPPASAVNPDLRLSKAARGIDFHQKGLLSDQIGVGMAAVLLGTYLNAPMAADVSTAIDDPAWPIDLQYATSPDYLFFDSTQANLFVVECKGTQTSRSASLDQLRRGTEQVPSLTFNDGRTPPSLIVATYLSKDATHILIVDPPANDEHPEKPERVSQREWRVRSDKEFTIAVRQISEAKVLAFAGAYGAAAGKLERARVRVPGAPSSVQPDLVTAENEFGTFRGLRQRVGVKDRFNIDVFQALDAQVYDALVSEDPARTDEELGTFHARSVARTVKLDPEQPIITVHEKGGALVVRSVAPDASLLEVRVSSP
jgi:hypothetical protein